MSVATDVLGEVVVGCVVGWTKGRMPVGIEVAAVPDEVWFVVWVVWLGVESTSIWELSVVSIGCGTSGGGVRGLSCSCGRVLCCGW